MLKVWTHQYLFFGIAWWDTNIKTWSLIPEPWAEAITAWSILEGPEEKNNE